MGYYKFDYRQHSVFYGRSQKPFFLDRSMAKEMRKQIAERGHYNGNAINGLIRVRKPKAD